jgi:phosphatidate cytidylyltransferase
VPTNPLPDNPTLAATAAATARRFDPRRVYTAAILAPAVYVIVHYLPAWSFALLLIAAGTLALLELYRISFHERRNVALVVIGLAATALIIARAYTPLSLTDVLTLTLSALVGAMVLSPAPLEHRFKDTAIALFGLLYVGLTLSTLVSSRSLPSGEVLVLFVALVTWAADIGAYYAGVLWGTHLLAPSISPKKTYEGLLGGMTVATGVACLAQQWFVPALSLSDALALGILLTGAGLLGDLCESAIKRSVGVKDSGAILPGHGGMLDRIDSLLFTAPAFYYYVTHVRGLALLPPS